MKKLAQFLRHRLVIGAVGITLQAFLLLLMIIRFNEYFALFYGFSVVLSVLAIVYIVNEQSNPAYKIAWLVPILLFPVFGGILYIMFGRNTLSKRATDRLHEIESRSHEAMLTLPNAHDELREVSLRASTQSNYIHNCAGMPIYKNTTTRYLETGEIKLACMLEELEKAEHFIFLEYFIIQEGVMWNSVLDILRRKAAQGVDVRVIFDDMGSVLTLPNDYDKKLESEGIACCAFNPFLPILSSKLNNRDHRKILVIDGHTGITGGINLADEYINEFEKHGHWKDSSILLKGDAVWNLTLLFLSMWAYARNTDEDLIRYMPHVHHPEPFESDGFVQPYGDSPLDNEPVGENIYLSIIERAEKYVYITTPYLIIDNEMFTSLATAAKSGIDVRIIMPHIADKWYVHAVTRANYPNLIKAGVKIYEYTPGFIHSKTFVSDDDYAVVGTINLDYRSLYLHFECAAFMYQSSCVKSVHDDFIEVLKSCQEITLEDYMSTPWYRRMGQSVLKVFAPVM